MGRSTEEASSAVQSTEEASSAVQPASDNTEPGSASSALQPAEPFGRTDPGGHSDDKDLPTQYVADGTDRFGPYQVHHTRSGTMKLYIPNSPYQLELQRKSAQEMAMKAKPLSSEAMSSEIWNPGSSGSCLLYTSPSPRDKRQSRMPSSA